MHRIGRTGAVLPWVWGVAGLPLGAAVVVGCSAPPPPALCHLSAGRKGKTGIATTFINKNQSESILLDLKHLLREAKQRIPPVLQARCKGGVWRVHTCCRCSAEAFKARWHHLKPGIVSPNFSPTPPGRPWRTPWTSSWNWRRPAARVAAPTAVAWVTALPTAPSCAPTRGSKAASRWTASAGAVVALVPKCDVARHPPLQLVLPCACSFLAPSLCSELASAASFLLLPLVTHPNAQPTGPPGCGNIGPAGGLVDARLLGELQPAEINLRNYC